MKERPILFSAPMVRAILTGNKTQTRRVVKPQPPHDTVSFTLIKSGEHKYEVGMRLWVRETFYPIQSGDRSVPRFAAVDGDYIYRADYEYRDAERSVITATKKWKPSIFMPRAASRITLEIVGVRVERLQEISEADAQAEGCDITQSVTGPMFGTFRGAYCRLWESINGKGSWALNPWLWVIEFPKL